MPKVRDDPKKSQSSLVLKHGKENDMNEKLTLLQMEFVITMMKAGHTFEECMNIMSGNYNSFSHKNVALHKDKAPKQSQDVKQDKQEEKQGKKKKDNKSTSKAKKVSKPKEITFGNIEEGCKFANYDLKDPQNPVLVGVHHAVKVSDGIVQTHERRNGEYVIYDINHCSKITLAKYRKLYKEFHPEKQDVNTSTRLCLKDYTIVLAHIARKENPELEYLFKDAQEPNKTKKQLENIRKIIKDKLPNLKITGKQAVEEFTKLLNESN